MLELLLIWLALMVALVVFVLPKPGGEGALVLSYFLSLSLIHVPGVLPYAALGYLPGADETRLGFEMTLLGLGAFVAAAIVARYTGRRRKIAASPPAKRLESLGARALIFGLVSYFLIIPVVGNVPSLTSLVSPLGTFLVVGLWLRLYAAANRGNLEKTAQALLLLPLLPMATLTTAGFIGYGVNWVISVLSFYFIISRQRLWFYAAAPFVVFLGLSFFVSYMGQRTGIRDVVWNENAGLEQRIDRVSQIFTQFSPLDLTSNDDIAALDGRLNQNYLVGLGIERHDAGQAKFEYGGTVPVWALVPRAFWPDKPDVGGGRQIVSDFTGEQFAEGTSVGAGQVLEFYMNFGVAGVLAGFAVLGFALMRLDRGIMEGLASGNVRQIVICAMPGLSLLEPGGNLMEILVAMVAAFASAYVVTYFNIFGLGGAARPRHAMAPVRR